MAEEMASGILSDHSGSEIAIEDIMEWFMCKDDEAQ